MGLDSAVKNSPDNAGNRSSVACLGRSPGEGDPCVCIESVMLSNHPILCTPFSFCLQPFKRRRGWQRMTCGVPEALVVNVETETVCKNMKRGENMTES